MTFNEIQQHIRAHAAISPARPLNLFALGEPEQDRAGWRRLAAFAEQSLDAKSLRLVESHDEAVVAAAPTFLQLAQAGSDIEPLRVALAAERPTHALTFLSSSLNAEALRGHLASCIDIRLPGRMDMLLALWDPALLGTIVGQRGDDTLHVPGPARCWSRVSARRCCRQSRLGGIATVGAGGTASTTIWRPPKKCRRLLS